MKIKKLTEEITYKEELKTYTFLINGKEIKIHTKEKSDEQNSDWEYDHEIDEDDAKELNEEEIEEVEELINDILETKKDEEWDSEKLPVTTK